ncbi:accessory gene regulator ArgB-like protein [Brevibacillus sp. HB2.2]|uniref:accessory gene regulator ArgB-like protein n=1 Tax=Brevibacillus sp. HB2.2 TaxID=2738846 RepID=UPI00156B8CA1|nr:accessory gene regulator B family protein [Brevibacillus sp. HB2.2]NRS51941.1 accessory gene regulator B family protein [Brevibacillus sp. HB2.2]
MIESIAFKIASSMKRINPDLPQSVAKLEYALIILLNGSTVVLCSLAIGFVLGSLEETALFLVAFASLRQVSGGYHLSTALGCAIVSIGMAVIVPFIPVTQNVGLILNCVSLVLVTLFSPSNIENQSRLPARCYPLLKIISITIVIATALIALPIITKAVFLQSLSLIRIRR